MHPFEQLIYDRFTENIATWDTEQHPDIYAISIWHNTFWGADAAGKDLAIQGQINLSYNTETNFETHLSRLPCANEARWNLAYWPSEISASVPRALPYGSDPPLDDFQLRDDWCYSMGVLPDNLDGGNRLLYGEPALYAAIREASVRIAQAMHDNGIIVGKFGRPIPIVIQTGSERMSSSAEATKAANPAGLAQ